MVLFLFFRSRPLPLPKAPSISDNPLSSIVVEEKESFRFGGDRLFVSAKISNSRADAGTRPFSYAFVLRGLNGEELERISDEDILYPGESVLVYGINALTPSKLISDIDVLITDADWRDASEFSFPKVSLESEPALEISDNQIQVRGVLKNETSSRISELKAVTTLRDSFGFKVLVTGTILTNLRSFASREYVIALPFDSELARRLQGGRAEGFFYPAN